MKRFVAWAGFCGLVCASMGCHSLNSQPAMREALVSPAQLQPGESALITVKINDRHDIVDRVVAQVKEDTRVKLPLNDEGAGGDAEAGDGVWTLKVDVPFTAPPGSYTLEIAALREDGEIIAVHEREAGDVPLMTTAKVDISYPEEATPATAAETAPQTAAEAAPAQPEAAAPAEQPAPAAPAEPAAPAPDAAATEAAPAP